LALPLTALPSPAIVLANDRGCPGAHILDIRPRIAREGEGLLGIVEHVLERPSLEQVIMEGAEGDFLGDGVEIGLRLLAALGLDLLGGEGRELVDEVVRVDDRAFSGLHPPEGRLTMP
jgi:hypothetical protein